MRAPCILAMISCIVLASPTLGQTTRPAAELAKENAELKKRMEKLEAYVAELEAKVRASKPSASAPPRADVRRFRAAPYGYELPAPPFNVPMPVPTPPKLPDIKPTPRSMPVVPPPSQFQAPENWQRREFNGSEFYLVPLR
jgi:hypothetical protein